jgi:hypothetical protein
MPGKRVITGWRQVKPEQGSSKRRLLPVAVAKPAPRATSGEAANNDRWESEGGSIVAS